MTRLKNKIAVVTGGSRGIGAAIVRRLAQEGANIAFSYVSSDKVATELASVLEKECAVKVRPYKVDASSIKESGEFINKVSKELGEIDILVNNAGVFSSTPLEDVTDEDFEKTLSINVRGVFGTAREAAKSMKEGGRIVLIGSVLGERAAGANTSVYNMTKFAVQGYGRSWAHDLAPRNITVNVIQPGPINTDMNPDNSDFAEAMKELIPLRRYGRPEEIAAAVAFFVSPEAGFVTGSILNVDGGLNA